MILQPVEANNGPFVYVDVREEYLTPADARDLAAKLLAYADQLEPAPEAENMVHT